MNIGIIVYSKTGNTLLVAKRIESALNKAGHQVKLEKVEAIDGKEDEKAELKTAPFITPYDVVIFGAPVKAFALDPVMKVYLAQIVDLQSKNIYCFVTQHFKKPWLGGNQAAKKIKSICKNKGGEAKISGVVNWSSANRETQINTIVNNLILIEQTEKTTQISNL